jgi:hypothetical protein
MTAATDGKLPLGSPSAPDPEVWILERLQDHGIDPYIDGEFAELRDRLAEVIVRNRFGSAVAGRHNQRPETYEQLFLRVYGLTPKDAVKGPTTRIAREATP